MSRTAIALISTALVTALATGCGGGGDDGGDDGGATLTISNDSSYILLEINLSPIDEAAWGPDLLGSETLDPGDTLELSSIDCDVYDIRVLDEDSDECILTDVDLCFDDSIWSIDDGELALCAF
jgi:hypothetical protein